MKKRADREREFSIVQALLARTGWGPVGASTDGAP